MSFSQNYINECIEICKQLNPNQIEDIALLINSVRDSKGRIFFLGVGGEQVMLRTQSMISEKYVELKAMLQLIMYQSSQQELMMMVGTLVTKTGLVVNLNENDMLFVFSVGGGNLEKNISVNILKSLQLAKSIGAKICGVVGRVVVILRKWLMHVLLFPLLMMPTLLLIQKHSKQLYGIF